MRVFAMCEAANAVRGQRDLTGAPDVPSPAAVAAEKRATPLWVADLCDESHDAYPDDVDAPVYRIPPPPAGISALEADYRLGVKFLGSRAKLMRDDAALFRAWPNLVARDCVPGLLPASLGAPSRGTPGLWDLEEGGKLGLVIPVWAGSVFADLVWTPIWDDPARWWVAMGAREVLGDVNVPADDGESLWLHETPLDWLRAGGGGACILDWKPARVRSAMSYRSEFMVGSKSFGDRFDKAMRVPKRYRIRVAP